jgi:hypothetical protein
MISKLEREEVESESNVESPKRNHHGGLNIESQEYESDCFRKRKAYLIQKKLEADGDEKEFKVCFRFLCRSLGSVAEGPYREIFQIVLNYRFKL